MSAFPNSQLLQPRLDADTAALAKGMDAVVIFVNDECDKEVIDILAEGGVKCIALRCAGFDRVDVEYAKSKGMRVMRVPAYSPNSVAEHAVALLMALNRNLVQAKYRVDSGNFSLSGLVGRELHGKTVGVWGTGTIGQIFCKIMLGFGCNVIACDRHPTTEMEDLGVTYVEQDTLVRDADVISLHLPLVEGTAKIVNADVLHAMKPDALLVNVSRGGLVDTDALIEALQSLDIGGAAIDVYEQEESLFFTDRSSLNMEQRLRTWDRRIATLRSLPNCLVTPHIAFLTEEALANIAATTITNLQSARDGVDTEGGTEL